MFLLTCNENDEAYEKKVRTAMYALVLSRDDIAVKVTTQNPCIYHKCQYWMLAQPVTIWSSTVSPNFLLVFGHRLTSNIALVTYMYFSYTEPYEQR